MFIVAHLKMASIYHLIIEISKCEIKAAWHDCVVYGNKTKTICKYLPEIAYRLLYNIFRYIMCIIKIDMIFYTVCIQNIYLYLTSSSHSSLMGIFIVVNRTTELRRCMLTLCWTILYCNNAFNHVKMT